MNLKINFVKNITISIVVAFFSVVLTYHVNTFLAINSHTKHVATAIASNQDKHYSKYSMSYRKHIKEMVMDNQSDGLKKQGMVAIPDVNILLPIYNDAYSDKGLSYGAAYANRNKLDPTGKKVPVFGKGNYGLAAHNFNDGKTGFSALQQTIDDNSPYINRDGSLGGSSWLNGTYVYTADKEGIYVYEITGQSTVPQSNTDPLNPTTESRLTIISCVFPNTQYRIVTIAKQVNHYSWANASDNEVLQFDLQHKNTNARVDWFNAGREEGANGSGGGTK